MRILGIAAIAAFIVPFGGCTRADVNSALPPQPVTSAVARVLGETSGYKQLYRFKGGQDGQNRHAGLTALGGLLYGTAELGGSSGPTCNVGCGTIFSIDPASGAETVVYRFKGGTDGAQPTARLTDVNGRLYGTTTRGGDVNCYGGDGCGTIFVFDPASGKERVLHGFSGGQDGQAPFAGVTFAGGKLYGTTVSGGSGCTGNMCGTIFSFDLATGQEHVPYAFKSGPDGDGPQADLVLRNGTFYGTTKWGGNAGCYQGSCGTIFSFDPSSGRERVVYRFTGGKDGAQPLRLTSAKEALFGVAFAGGNLGCPFYNGECGTVFSFNPSTGTETTAYAFKGGQDGEYPIAIVAANHSLYGATLYGGVGCGSAHCGTVFALDPTSGKKQTLYRFQGLRTLDGAYPEALLIFAGKLYGTTAAGGDRSCKADGGCGTVFALNE